MEVREVLMAGHLSWSQRRMDHALGAVVSVSISETVQLLGGARSTARNARAHRASGTEEVAARSQEKLQLCVDLVDWRYERL